MLPTILPFSLASERRETVGGEGLGMAGPWECDLRPGLARCDAGSLDGSPEGCWPTVSKLRSRGYGQGLVCLKVCRGEGGSRCS